MLGKTPSELTLQVEYFTSNGPAFTFGPQAYGNDAVTGQPRIFTTRSDGPPPGVWGGVARDSYFTRAPAGHLRFISGGWEVNLRASTFRRGSPYWSFGDFDNASAGELDRFLALDVKYRRALSRLADVSVRAYGDLYDYEYRIPQPAAETCLDGQTHGCVGVDLGASRWMGVETQLSFDWSTDTRFKTLLGMDARVRHVASEYQYVDAVTGVNPGSIGAFDTTEKLLALYAQQIVRPVAWLGINAGVRGDIEERFARASPRVAASARVWKDGTVKAIYAEAFRTPSTYERFFVDPSSEIGAPNLRPETVRSAEVSFEQRFGAQRILFGVFRSWWDDMISLEGLSEAEAAAAKARGEITPQTQAVTQYRNVSSIDNVGFNATYDGALGTERVRYALNVTAASARRNEEGEPTNRPLEVSPQIFGNARVAYDLGVGLPTLALAARYAGKAPLYNAYERAFPLAYATSMVETRATASGAMPGIAGLAYRFSASYAWNARTAYTAGPIEQATPELPRMERVPMERLRLMLGLEYVLDFAKAR
jgi:outer membrane receptor protein involved in Fe transport